MPRKQLKPPIKLRRKFAALIELCRNKILTAPPQTNGTSLGNKLITVTIRWHTKPGKVRMLPDLPEDFPTGVVVSRDNEHVTIRHSVIALLTFFRNKGYITYDAKSLFAARLPVMMSIAKLELGLERYVDLLQQVEQDLLADKGDSEYNGCIR